MRSYKKKKQNKIIGKNNCIFLSYCSSIFIIIFFVIIFLIYIFFSIFFFFNDTATTEIYTLSLHDALPICQSPRRLFPCRPSRGECPGRLRSEDHTSELQSRFDLVCRLLLEKKKKKHIPHTLSKKNNKIQKNNIDIRSN